MKLTVEKLIFGGWGLARTEGKVVLVAGVLPGEVVEVEVQREHRDYIVATLKEVLSPSPKRIDPRCPHFGDCGGCDYQHIPYDLQPSLKEEILREELRRIGQIPPEAVKPTIPSPQDYGWRIRLDLAIEVGERLKIGFYRRGTREIVDIERCPVAHPLAERILERFRLALERHLILAPVVRRLEITISPDENKGHMVIYCLIHHDKKHMRQMAEELVLECNELKDVLIKHRALVFPHSVLGKGRTQSALEFSLNGVKILSYPGVFLQANPQQNKRLIKYLKERLGEGLGEVLELFSGIGNLSLPLAPQASFWTGVERSKLSVKNANYNAQKNGIKARFVCEEALKLLENWQREGRRCDLLLLDPPRQGALEELKRALSLNPSRIAYVSCNPSTLARDLRFLIDQGYVLEEITPFDFFPQTYHIESVSILRKL